jgi:hypothetical protein
VTESVQPAATSVVGVHGTTRTCCTAGRRRANWLTRHLGQPACRGAIGFCREVSTYLSKPVNLADVGDLVAVPRAD